MKTEKIFFVLCIVLGSCLLNGCGPEKPEGLPTLYPLTLTVTQDGKPAADVMVSLRSTNPGMVWTVGGKTNSDGNTQLMTHGQYVGVPEGKYKVVLSKTENEGYEEYIKAKDRYDDAAAAKIDVKFYSVIDTEYNSPQTTPIEIEVTRKTKSLTIDGGPIVRIEQEFMR